MAAKKFLWETCYIGFHCTAEEAFVGEAFFLVKVDLFSWREPAKEKSDQRDQLSPGRKSQYLEQLALLRPSL